jgi:enamine deaminase RidA (YjgF/YER057c/UK114 family)
MNYGLFLDFPNLVLSLPHYVQFSTETIQNTMRLFAPLLVLAGTLLKPAAAQTVQFYGTSASPISSGAVVPADKKLLWTSGAVAAVADSTAAPGSPARYGDTKTQALSILKNFEGVLKRNGLSFRDVLMLRVYVAPDAQQGGKHDYQGFFDAYAQYFGTATNPTKPTRSTLGIAALVRPELLIEIEMVAVFP